MVVSNIVVVVRGVVVAGDFTVSVSVAIISCIAVVVIVILSEVVVVSGVIVGVIMLLKIQLKRNNSFLRIKLGGIKEYHSMTLSILYLLHGIRIPEL